MTQIVYNVHKDRIYEAYLSGKTFGILLLKTTNADAQAADLTTVAELLAVPGVAECDFTNYVRKSLSSVASAQDDGNDTANVSAGIVVWSEAGGAVNNNPAAAVIYEEGASDSVRYLVDYYDTNFSNQGTNGAAYSVVISNLLSVS